MNLYRNFYYEFGFGERAEFHRSGLLISTVESYIIGAAGGKAPNRSPDEIYTQLSYSTNKKRPGNNAVNWDKTPEHIKKQLIAKGMFSEDGDSKPYNPHGR